MNTNLFLNIIRIAALPAVLLSAAGVHAAEPAFANVTATVGLPVTGRAPVAWGDYDKDGRPDLLVGGGLWQNTASGFVNVTASVAPGLSGGGAVAWADYDKDGRLDFYNSGRLWWNTGSGFVNVTDTVAPGLVSGAITWGDYDNDGRLDFLVSGAFVAQIWRNTGNGFINVTATVAPGLRGIQEGSVAWGDYDNDGRLDFIITGGIPRRNDQDDNYPYYTPFTQIWRNTGGGFVNVTSLVAPNLPGAFWSTVAWGDYDNDGRLDFLLTGYNGGSFSQIWRNTGYGFANVTTTVAPNLQGVIQGPAAWGDYDGDGLLDILLSGYIWRNTGSGFSNVTAVVAPDLSRVVSSSLAWGDYNSDGRLDFLLTGDAFFYCDGCDAPPTVFQLWQNNTAQSTPPPAVITGLPGDASQTGVPLNGRVNPRGRATAAWFVWGTTTNYGQATAAQPMGNGNAFANFSQTITGLSTGVTYYYRAVGSNDQGQTFIGFEQMFTLAAPIVYTVPGESYSPTVAAFHGRAYANNLPAYGWFEWGLSPAYGQTTPVRFIANGSADFGEPVSGLASNTTYYFRAVASNSLGVVYGGGTSVTTPGMNVCLGSLSPTSKNASSLGGYYSVYVLLQCDWAAINTNSWITIISPTNGSAFGSWLSFYVAANTLPVPRIGYLTIGGNSFKVSQVNGGPSLTAEPSTQNVLGGGTATFSVTMTGTPAASYQWEFNSVPLTNGNGISGATTANLMLTGVPYAQAGSYRVIALDASGAPIGFSSSATLTVSCGFSISSNNASFNSLSATGLVSLSMSAADCPWAVVNTNAWVNIVSGINYKGNGTVVYALTENPTLLPRGGTLTIADQTFAISQAGGSMASAPMSLAEALDTEGEVSWGTIGTPEWFGQTFQSHDGADAAQSGPIGHNGAVTLQTTLVGPGTISFWWKVSSETNADYLKFFINGVQQSRISGEEGWQQQTFVVPSGGPVLKWTYSKNPSETAGQDRGWLDQVLFIPSNACNLALSPTNRINASSSATGLVFVSTSEGCPWTLVNTNDWVQIVSGASGTGNGQIDYLLTDNPGPPRTGNLVVADQVFVITQLEHSTNASISLADALDTGASLTWDTIGAPAWFGQTSVSHDGMDAAQSGAAVHNSAVTITTTVEGPGAVSFWWKVSSETDKDYLKFFINGVQQSRISGEVNWETQRYVVPAGTQVFKWTYSKNATGSWGLDRGWVDQVRFFPGAGECVINLSHTGVTHSHVAEAGQVEVSTTADCSWGVVNTNWWITPTIIGGEGNGFVYYTLAANASTTGRSGVLLIAGQPFTISQLGVPCTYSISPGTRSHSYGAGTGSVSVTTQTGCSWAVVNSNAWVTILPGGNAPGNGVVTYSISENTSVARSGNLVIGGKLYFISQAGSLPCAYSLSLVGVTHGFASSTGMVSVSTPGICAWNVSNTNTWVTILSPSNNSGSGQVIYGVAANTTSSARSGNILIGDQIFSLNQAAPNPNPVILPEALDTTSTSLVWRTGGSGTWFGQSTVTHDGVDAAQSGPVGWRSSSGLATTVTGPGTLTFWWKVSSEAGHDGLHFFVGASEQASISGEVDWQQRTVNLPAGTYNLEWNYIGDDTVKAGQDCGWVDQVQFVPSTPCSVTLSSPNALLPASGSTGSVNVVSAPDCPWSAFTTNSWIHILSGAIGAGNGTVTLMFSANTNVSVRSGIVRIGDQNFVFTQSGTNPPQGCTYLILPGSRTHGYAATSNTVTMTSQNGCPWSVGTTNSWISILSILNSVGNGTVFYSIAANPSSQPRSGAITIAGQNFLITQTGSPNPQRLQFMGLSGAGAMLSVQGPAGKLYAIEYSQDLIHWSAFSTNAAPSTVTNAGVGNVPWRFYRSVER